MPCSSEEAATTSVSEVATTEDIDFNKFPQSEEAFVALFRVFVKDMDKAASEKKAKALHKRHGLNQWNVFQTNHHWVYLCLEEAVNEHLGLDMANVLTQYAPTCKDARSQFYFHMLIGSQFALTLTSTNNDLDGQLERPPSNFSEVMDVIESYERTPADETPVLPVPQALVPVSAQRTEAAPEKPVLSKQYWSNEERDLIKEEFMSLLLPSHLTQKKIKASIVKSKLESTPSLGNIISKFTFNQIKDKLWALVRNKPTFQ